MIEFVSSTSATVSQAVGSICQKQDLVSSVLAPLGIAIQAAGTSPVDDSIARGVMPVTLQPRLGVVLTREGARQMDCCGLHVHVAVSSREAAVRASNILRLFLPHLLALSANSQVQHGLNTKKASSRLEVLRRMAKTRGGPPPHYVDWENGFVQWMKREEALAGHGLSWNDVWPDIRITSLGTVEIRIADSGCLSSMAMIAAVCQCIVAIVDNPRLPDPLHLRDLDGTVSNETIRDNLRKAEVAGLDASIALGDSAQSSRPLRDDVTDLINGLADTAAILKCSQDLALAHRVLQRGTASDEQVFWLGSGDVDLLTAAIVRRTYGVPGDPYPLATQSPFQHEVRRHSGYIVLSEFADAADRGSGGRVPAVFHQSAAQARMVPPKQISRYAERSL